MMHKQGKTIYQKSNWSWYIGHQTYNSIKINAEDYTKKKTQIHTYKMKNQWGSNLSERDLLLQHFADWISVVTIGGGEEGEGKKKNLILYETQRSDGGKEHNALILLHLHSVRHPLHHDVPFA